MSRRLLAPFVAGGRLAPLRLLKQDLGGVRRRYLSDWTTFNQRVLASAVYVFFTNILPGITFASDLYVLTGRSWGTIEVVLSTGLCGVVFAVASAQPLTILGVTGPFSVLAENLHALCVGSLHVDFLALMAWSLIHAAWMHYLLAVFNAHDWTMRYVTAFSADVFSLLNSVIYIYKAGLELRRNHDRGDLAVFVYAVAAAAGTCLVAVFLSTATSWRPPLFGRAVRLVLAEYAAALSIVLFVALPRAGELATLDHDRLAVQEVFRPSDPARPASFVVDFWTLPARWALAAVVPGAVITVLFFFDHEISSIICAAPRYGVRKPAGFAWDIVLLGTTTALCGVLGLPPANGLLPQAPLHSESLMDASPDAEPRISEQRYSPLFQAAAILAFTSPPLQRLLGLTPTSVLAGLFLFMAYQSLAANPILPRLAYLVTPPADLPCLPSRVRWRSVHAYTLVQVAVTAAIFAVTLTVAAPAFPLLVIALVPLRLLVMNRLWDRDTLRWVDGWACREGKPEDGEPDEETETEAQRRQEENAEKTV